MKKIKLIALFAALIVGLGIYQFLKEISKPEEIPHTDVVAALTDIPENTQITPDMLVIKSVPTESLQPGIVTDIDAVSGMVAAGDIFAGEQITERRLTKMGEEAEDISTLAHKVEPGMRAITISVNAVTGLENTLRPGNRVDLLVNANYRVYSPDGFEEEERIVTVSTVLIDNIEILAVSNVMAKEGATEYATVTLHVTPEQALLINYASAGGGNDIGVSGMRLILRSPLDEEPLEIAEVFLDDILGEEIAEKYPQSEW